MKKTIYNKVVGIVFLAILFSHVVYAQNERNKALIYSYLHGWEYSIKAGLSIGGTSPLPLPKEIRSIDSYAPNIAIAIEGNATKWFGNDKKWGMTAGIRLENKTMTTEATVKNYGMKIINTNGGELQGLWTGGVKTKVKNSYLTIPLLANYKISDRWTRNQLEYIQRNANRLLHLVNQLMDYRRAELGVFELKAKKANAYQLIQENFLFYDKLARHKKITYTLHSDLEDKEVLFDPNYLELIVNNLLSNAFKYTESGQSITVTLKEENNYLVLQVSDTGIGIPINKQGKIFERFYQIESEHVGSGIGLSLIQRLVELHHGHIELDSEEGKGSTFSVYLPQDISIYKPSELAANGKKSEEEQVYSTNSKEMYFIDTEKVENEAIESGDKKRGTILIVEDNNEIRHYLSSGLAELFNILEAGNGEEALEKLKGNEVDIIVTDVMMPVMDGIKLCKNVKQNIPTCHIPVIMLSAKSEIKDQMEGLQMGADDYIPKPFSLSILTTKIQNMMRTRRRMLERYSKSLEVEPEKITFNAMDEALLKRAVSIVEKNMDNIEFSTDEFAREMNMSRSNLHLKLKAITGESTIDFIRKIRFNEAAKLLKDGRYTVAEVSTMVGFNTPSYFATSFKKYFGYLPTEYIKRTKG